MYKYIYRSRGGPLRRMRSLRRRPLRGPAPGRSNRKDQPKGPTERSNRKVQPKGQPKCATNKSSTLVEVCAIPVSIWRLAAQVFESSLRFVLEPNAGAPWRQVPQEPVYVCWLRAS